MTTYRVDIDGNDELALWRLESGDDWGEAIANLYGGDTAVTSGHEPDHGVVFRAAAAVLAPDEEVSRLVSKRVNGCACKNCLGFTVAVLAALRAHAEEGS